MSDEIDEDLLKELGDLGGDVDGGALDTTPFDEIGTAGTTVAATKRGGRSRIVGLLALLLGVIGCALAAIFAVMSIRFGFGASDTVDRAMQPVEMSFDRLEARIDETDDLVNRNGTEPDRVEELQARADSLRDVATGVHQVYDQIENHPIYSLLPADLSPLGDALEGFEQSAESIDDRLGSTSNGTLLGTNVVSGVSDELDDMQGRVSGVRAMLTDAADSLRRWIRIGSLLGFLGSLWGLWGQFQLAKRGWRGFRGRDL